MPRASCRNSIFCWSIFPPLVGCLRMLIYTDCKCTPRILSKMSWYSVKTKGPTWFSLRPDFHFDRSDTCWYFSENRLGAERGKSRRTIDMLGRSRVFWGFKPSKSFKPCQVQYELTNRSMINYEPASPLDDMELDMVANMVLTFPTLVTRVETKSFLLFYNCQMLCWHEWFLNLSSCW